MKPRRACILVRLALGIIGEFRVATTDLPNKASTETKFNMLKGHAELAVEPQDFR